MIRVMIFLLFIASLANANNLIPAEQLFRSDLYSSFKLSPNGRYLMAQKNYPEKTLLIVRELSSVDETILVSFHKNEAGALIDFEWLDEGLVYLQFSKRKLKTRLMEVYHAENGIQNKGYDVHAVGRLVDPMLDIEDQFLFAEFIGEDDGFRVVKTDRQKLISGELGKLDDLNMGLDNASGFVTDAKHRIRLAVVQKDEGFDLMFRAIQSKKWIKIFGSEHRKDTFRPIVVSDSDDIFAISNINRDKAAVVKFNINQRDNVEVIYESSDYDITNASIDAETGLLSSVTFVEHGVPKVKYLLAESDESYSEFSKAFKAKKVYRLSRSFDEKHSIYSVENADYPRRFYYQNEQENKIYHLYDSLPELSEVKFQPTKIEQVTISKDFSLEAYLTLPNNSDANFPLVVMPHGGPIGVRDLNLFDKRVQFLANRGFSVLRVNFRGSKGFGKSFQQSGVSQWGKGIESDINKAVDHVINKYSIDKQRMCIIGGSYGGYSALMSTINYPDKYKCVVSYFGVTDLPLLYSSNNLYLDEKRRIRITNTVGNILSNFVEAKHQSPVYRANEINVPVLLMAGGKDLTAYPEHTLRLSYVLDKLNKEHELIIYPNSGHSHSDWIGVRHQFIKIAHFLNKHLKAGDNFYKTDKKLLADEMLFMSTQYRASGVVEIDQNSIVEYANKAAILGNTEAKYLMGSYYEKGIVFEQNNVTAFDWYNQAANEGNVKAVLKIAKAYQNGLLGLNRNEALAFEYYSKSFSLNSFNGTYQMALMMICKDQKLKAIELLSSLEGKAQDYSGYSVNDIKKRKKENMRCQ